MDPGLIPKKGAKVADFTLPDHLNQLVSLSELVSRRPVLLLFYPTDFGMHCSIQMGEMRDHLPRFEALGMQVVGISTNTPHSHGTWMVNMKIPFRLLSDQKGEVARSWGMMCPEDSWLKGRSCRAAFLVGKDMAILYTWVPNDQSIIPDVEELYRGCAEALKGSGKT